MDSKAGNGTSVSIPIKGRGIHSAALLAFVPVFLASLASCGTTYPHDTASAIVTAPYPGKHELNQCSPYADALFGALKANNIEAWKVYYMGGYWAKTNYHAMVVYKDAGCYWYADNIFPFPTRSWGKTPRECAHDRGDRENGYCVVLKVIAAQPGLSDAPQ